MFWNLQIIILQYIVFQKTLFALCVGKSFFYQKMAFWFLYCKNRNAAKRFEKGWWGSGKKGRNFLKSFSLLPRSQNNLYREHSHKKMIFFHKKKRVDQRSPLAGCRLTDRKIYLTFSFFLFENRKVACYIMSEKEIYWTQQKKME